ncbi:MAG: MBL fold metallo-hydrolase [Bacilli bacterium]|nr:MBL fold metallo-hydrolase [Bacilli bacterium]
MTKVVPFIYEDRDDLYANTYVLIDDDKKCVVIDPAKAYDGLVNYIKKNDLTLKAILLTHGHADHIRGVDTLVNAFNAPVYIGFEDLDMLSDTFTNCSEFLGENITVKAKAETLIDNEILHLIKEDIQVIATPYHTAGGVCFYLKDSGILFTGDFIIPHGVGRSDLPNAKPHEFNKSIAKILKLPISVKIYGGHERTSTLETELRINQYLK